MMGTETVVTLALVAVLVAVLALYIVAIGLALRKLSFTLGTIVIGLRAIAQQTAPVGPVVGDLIGDVDVIEDALDSLIAAVVSAKKVPARSRAALRPAPVDADYRAAAATVVDDDDELAPAVATVGGRTVVRSGRRPQARSSGRGPRRAARAAPGQRSMSAAVARAREKVEPPPAT